MGPLSRAFLATWKGTTAAAEDFESVLLELCARARSAWNEFSVEDSDFCGYLGERAPPHLPPARAVSRLRVEELLLACACVRCLPAALRAFDERLLSRVGTHLSRLQSGPQLPQLIDETRQLLRVKLLAPSGDAPPKISQYNGQGSLDGWVRVASIRTAINLAVAERARPSSEPLDSELISPGEDPELDYLRTQYNGAFIVALRRAISELRPRDRAQLRFHFIDGLTPEHIGGIYGVHRTTVMRQIAAAQTQVLGRTRALVMGELGVTPSECDGLIELVRSRMPFTLSSILRSRSA